MKPKTPARRAFKILTGSEYYDDRHDGQIKAGIILAICLMIATIILIVKVLT